MYGNFMPRITLLHRPAATITSPNPDAYETLSGRCWHDVGTLRASRQKHRWIWSQMTARGFKESTFPRIHVSTLRGRIASDFLTFAFFHPLTWWNVGYFTYICSRYGEREVYEKAIIGYCPCLLHADVTARPCPDSCWDHGRRQPCDWPYTR